MTGWNPAHQSLSSISQTTKTQFHIDIKDRTKEQWFRNKPICFHIETFLPGNCNYTKKCNQCDFVTDFCRAYPQETLNRLSLVSSYKDKRVFCFETAVEEESCKYLKHDIRVTMINCETEEKKTYRLIFSKPLTSAKREERQSWEHILVFVQRESDDAIDPSGSFRIECAISVTQRDNGTPEFAQNAQDEYFENIRKVQSDQKTADIQIICENVTFDCHKNILVARSPVLKAYIFAQSKESKEGKIHINDTRPEIMKRMIHFMYKGYIDHQDASYNNHDEVCLLMLADKYDLKTLKNLCASRIVSHINEENFLENYKLISEMFSYENYDFKDKLNNYFCKNMKGIIKNKNDWTRFMEAEANMCYDLLQQFCNFVSPP